jgi:hypothetical protein
VASYVNIYKEMLRRGPQGYRHMNKK